MTLKQRAEIANEVPNAILVSVHLNASKDAGERGFETMCLSPLSPQDDPLQSGFEEPRQAKGRRLANEVQEALDKAVGDVSPSRGVRGAGFHILRESNGPAVLVEAGYLTNSDDAALLKDESHLDKVAGGIAAGIDAFAQAAE